MEITEVRVFLKEGQDKKLKAYTTVTLDRAFVVRNIKVIQGGSSLFIAMPSRKLRLSCPKCDFKNEVGSKFCNQCAAGIHPRASGEQGVSHAKTGHRDVVHPITQEFREYLQTKILKAYETECEREPS